MEVKDTTRISKVPMEIQDTNWRSRVKNGGQGYKSYHMNDEEHHESVGPYLYQIVEAVDLIYVPKFVYVFLQCTYLFPKRRHIHPFSNYTQLFANDKL